MKAIEVKMLTGLKKVKQQVKKPAIDGNSLIWSITTNSIILLAIIALIVASIYPEIVLAVNLEQQLDKVGAVANGKFKTIGLTAATIGGAIWSVIKGNLKLTGIIIAIGICLSLYLEWIAGGMVLTA